MDTNRREFIKLATGTTAAFTLGIPLAGCNSSIPSSSAFSPNALLSIFPDNRVTIILSKIEMGQGVINAIPTIIAEELDLDWSTIEVKLADANPKYGQLRTSGSNSIKNLWQPLREGAARARTLLIQAASQVWEVNKEELSTKQSHVVNKLTGQQISYGELAQLASTLPPPEKPTLKEAHQFGLVGSSTTRLNAQDIVTGQAQYGIDTTLKNLHYAAIVHAPSLNGKLSSVSQPDLIATGVMGIVELDNAVAVVADSYWLARKVLQELKIEWHSILGEPLEQAQIERDFERALEQPGELVKKKGNANTLADYTISTDYYSAYQAHACMEPINCTAHIHNEGCDIWAPTQHPMMALSEARKAYHSQIGKWSSKILRKLGISDNVNVHTTLIGGGFGRRLEQDFVTEAVTIAKHFDFPVKLIWSREEDIKNDFYRPYSAHRINAKVEKGEITKWKHQAAGASLGKISFGALNTPYNIPNKSLYFTTIEHGIPIGSWRSVAHSNHVFATESFLDEIAHSEKIDPLSIRQNLLFNDTRATRVLSTLKSFSGWDYKVGQSFAKGIAFNFGFDSYIGLVVQINKHSANIEIKDIYCVVDCGIIIDPDSVKAQIEGGIIFGLNAATSHEITIKNNQVEQGNFDNYPLLRLQEMPNIHIRLIDSENHPGGVGEISVPVVAPALANAIFAAIGVRHNKVPISQMMPLV